MSRTCFPFVAFLAAFSLIQQVIAEYDDAHNCEECEYGDNSTEEWYYDEKLVANSSDLYYEYYEDEIEEETTTPLVTKVVPAFRIETHNLNLTHFYEQLYNIQVNKRLPISLEDDLADYTDCHTCYRLSKIVSTRPDVRQVRVDTCSHPMPVHRCYAKRAKSKEQPQTSIAPSCVKSYIREGMNELVMRGCYSPHAYFSSSSSSSGSDNLRNETDAGSSQSYTIAYKQCENGFGNGSHRRLSVYIWCCNENFCNSAPVINKPVVHIFAVLFMMMLLPMAVMMMMITN